MEPLTRDDLKILMEKRQGPCISLFMPTHRAGETQQNAIRFKNLLREAEKHLIERGQDERNIQQLLIPAQALLNANDFWQHQRDGLALFRSPEFFQYYRLPFHLDELVIVADHFYIKPLLPMLSGDGRFYVLALSQNEIRLLQGTRYSVHGVDLEGIPENLAEALHEEYPEVQIQFHTSTPGGRGTRRPAVFYGYSAGMSESKDRVLRYFRELDKGLHELLKDERAPLILAGVEYILPIYKEANTYPHLMNEGILGNPELISVEELHKRAWTIVQPHFQQAQEEAAAKYRLLAGTGQASNNIREILPASYYGRVETLFVAIGHQQWGTFDRITNTVNLHVNPEPGDEDLLDLAAAQTLSHGGTVYAVDAEKVPDDQTHGPIVAVFRY